MPTPQLSDEEIFRTVEAWRRHRRQRETIAAELGISESKLDYRLKIASAKGYLLSEKPMPGFRISQVTDGPRGQSVTQRPEPGPEFAVPPGHAVKGVSALLDPDGREVVKWVKTKEGTPDPLQIAEWLKASFKDINSPQPVSPPENTASDLLTLAPCADWHLGLHAWQPEVGENWDLKIAEPVIGQSVEDAILRAPASSRCIVLGGGDLLHFDNKRMETTAGTRMDADGRYQKVVTVAQRVAVRAVDAALHRHQTVLVRILPGNHDEHAAVAIAHFLAAWYRNEPRVTVDTSPSLFFVHRFGKVLLGATHGHTVKIARMPSIMAHRWAEDWGATRFRYVHGFHLHHKAKTTTEGEGCVTEIHQAPVPQDAWHYGSGFLSGRSVQTISYHATFGEVSRVRVAILDGEERL